MKYIYLLVAFVCVQTIAWAQPPALNWTPSIDKANGNNDEHLIYVDDNYNYVLYNPDGENSPFVFQKTDREGKSLFAKQLKPNALRAKMLRVLRVNGKFVLVYEAFSLQRKLAGIYAVSIDEDGNIDPATKTIYEVAVTKHYSPLSTFVTSLSPDNSKLAIRFGDGTGGFKLFTYKTIVLDQSMTAVLTADDKDPASTFRNTGAASNMYQSYPQKERGTCFCVNNSGDVYMLRQQAWQSPNFLVVKHSGTATTEQLVDAGGMDIHEILIGINAKGNLVISGFYAPDSKHDYEGTFSALWLAGSNSIEKSTFKPFEPDASSAANDEMNASQFHHSLIPIPGVKKEMREMLNAAEMISTPDYTYYIAEIFFTDIGSAFTGGNRSGRGGMECNYRSIFVTVLDADGKMINTFAVNKSQDHISRNTHRSYCSFTMGNKLCLLFNDNEKDYDASVKSDLTPHGAWDKTVTKLVTINPTGTNTRDPMFYAKDIHATILPATIIQVGYHHVALIAEHIGATNHPEDQFNIGRFELVSSAGH